MNPFAIDQAFPPSIADMPLLVMVIVMAFWAVILMCLTWIYELIDAEHDMPSPRGSYIRISRRVRIGLLIAVLCVVGPRLLMLMAWQMLSPALREAVSVLTWISVVPGAALIIYAWWRDKATAAAQRDYVRHNGFVMTAPMERSEKTRGIIVLVLIFAVAFATTFVRPSQDVRTNSNPVVSRG